MKALAIAATGMSAQQLNVQVIANNIANFVPSLYDPAQAVSVTSTGLIVPGSGNRYNGLIRAGNGVPADQVVADTFC